jgi:hypothetical protein
VSKREQAEAKGEQQAGGGECLALGGSQAAETASADQVGGQGDDREAAAKQEAKEAELALGERGIGEHATIIALGEMQPREEMRVVVGRMDETKGIRQ